MTAASITDFTQFAGLRSAAERNDPAAIREVANQFEALFVQMMLKNMRDSSLAEPIFGKSDQQDMYQEMMDKQLSLEMANAKGIGLADMLVRQLGGDGETNSRRQGSFNLPMPVRPAAAATRNPPRPGPEQLAVSDSEQSSWKDPGAFVSEIWPHAQRAARRLNVAPEALLAQAALETGWGEHVMQRSDGSSSFNLFGIKAHGAWAGDSVSKATLEFDAGVAKPQLARFRAYENMAATFIDYSDLISQNPRYESVRGHGDDVEGFARALQSSGYATDPAYADKLTSVLRSDTMKKALLNLQSDDVRPITLPLSLEST